MNKPVLILALAATVLAVIFAPKEDDQEVVAPLKHSPRAAAPTAGGAHASAGTNANAGGYQLQVVPRNYGADMLETSLEAGEMVVNEKGGKSRKDGQDAKLKEAKEAKEANIWGSKLFLSTNWAPPPPPPPKEEKPAPPPPPSAPPLPFMFMGRWIEDGKVRYFLQHNDRNLVVQVGDTIEQQYKLDSAQGGQLQFTYLPLHQQQTLAVGEVN